MNMEGKFTDVKVIELKNGSDERGESSKFFSKDNLRKAGVCFEPIEVLYIHSNKGVFRGIHYQKVFSQSRLIACTRGRLFVVVVNVDEYSAHFGQVETYVLEDASYIIYIPKEYAVGTLAVEDSDFVCLCGDNPFMQNYSAGIKWDDAIIDVAWPINKMDMIISKKDLEWPCFRGYNEK